MDWLENPQLSTVGKPYGLGNPDKTSVWKKLMTDCKGSLEEYFSRVKETFYDPEALIMAINEIIAIVNEITVLQNERRPIAEKKISLDEKTNTIMSRLNESLLATANIEEVKAYLSCLIIAYGLIEETYRFKRATPEVIQLYESQKLYLFMTYATALTILGSKYNADEFLTIDQFKRLTDANFKTRSTVKKERAPPKKKCGVDLLESCSASFGQVMNKEFKVLADMIECHCSFFKQKLVPTNSALTLFEKKFLNNISSTDISTIKGIYGVQVLDPKPTIAIHKYPSGTCETKDYLSQLFMKCCSLFPSQFKPVKETEDAYTTTNLLNTTTGSYYGGHLNVFQTNIEGMDQMSTVPVYFVNEDNAVYYDIYKGPTKQLFNDIFHELLIHKVFVGMTTYFNNLRYVLNLDLNIAKFPFYKDLPASLKTDALKEKLTNYFYLFLGNLMHFAVANNMELPFKLSRAYIVKLFNILDFTTNNDTKMLLISIFLTEQTPMYTKAVLKLFDNPRDEEALMVVSTLYDPPGGMKVDNFQNMFNYLFETAYKFYFQDINNDEPIGDMSLHPRLEYFFKGFTHYREYHHNEERDFKPLKVYDIPVTVGTDVRHALIRKLDYYLSGPGLNHATIRERFIPQIRYELDNQLYRFTNLEQIISTIPDNLTDPDTTTFGNLQQKIVYWLFRILLDKGKNMPEEFKTVLKNKFNFENLSDEEYHYEFVKLLLKTWTGVSYINNSTVYKIGFVQLPRSRGLPVTHTCFNELVITRRYSNAEDLYKDLRYLVTEGTNFGEVLAGGCSRCSVKKGSSKKNLSASLSAKAKGRYDK
jgi:hypothetical protein